MFYSESYVYCYYTVFIVYKLFLSICKAYLKMFYNESYVYFYYTVFYCILYVDEIYYILLKMKNNLIKKHLHHSSTCTSVNFFLFWNAPHHWEY